MLSPARDLRCDTANGILSAWYPLKWQVVDALAVPELLEGTGACYSLGDPWRGEEGVEGGVIVGA